MLYFCKKPEDPLYSYRDNLRKVLELLRFHVEVHENKTTKEVKQILKMAGKENHRNADCLLITGQNLTLQGLKQFCLPIFVKSSLQLPLVL